MTDRPPPTAAELGVSEAEYVRIVQDLDDRGAWAPGARPDVPFATDEVARRTSVVPLRSRRGTRRRWPVYAAVALAALWLTTRIDSDDGQARHEFTALQDDGSPVTYSSCKPVRVAVYPAGGPSNAEELVRQAAVIVSDATGLDISVIGVFGGQAAQWNFKTAVVRIEDPVVVSWQDGDTLEQMTDDVAGLGGSPYWTLPSGTKAYSAGTIALSREYYQRLQERGDHAEALAVLLHEFGHVLGLAHVDDEGELMDSSNGDLDAFGPGDLEGLRALGSGPCF